LLAGISMCMKQRKKGCRCNWLILGGRDDPYTRDWERISKFQPPLLISLRKKEEMEIAFLKIDAYVENA
jgi:hypothetical protein